MSVEKPENLMASLSFYLDQDEMIWVAAEWTETEEGLDAFAEFMFKLNSGIMLSDCLEFLKEECETSGKLDMYKLFIIKLNALYDDAHINNRFGDEPVKERPVVRPTKVKSLGY